jgi:hypothetical protein
MIFQSTDLFCWFFFLDRFSLFSSFSDGFSSLTSILLTLLQFFPFLRIFVAFYLALLFKLLFSSSASSSCSSTGYSHYSLPSFSCFCFLIILRRFLSKKMVFLGSFFPLELPNTFLWLLESYLKYFQFLR